MSSARHKLNAAYIHGSLIIAGLIGAIGGSWNVFILVAAVLTATSVLGGEIRIKQQTRRRWPLSTLKNEKARLSRTVGS